MKALGIDGRTAEEKLMDELRLEEEQKRQGLMNLELSSGIGGGPSVNVLLDPRKNYAPKQNLKKPEKSIKLMQQRGIAG